MTHFRKRARPKNSIFWGVCPTKSDPTKKLYLLGGLPDPTPDDSEMLDLSSLVCRCPGTTVEIFASPTLAWGLFQRWSGDYKQRRFHRGPWANVRRARERDSPRIDSPRIDVAYSHSEMLDLSGLEL